MVAFNSTTGYPPPADFFMNVILFPRIALPLFDFVLMYFSFEKRSTSRGRLYVDICFLYNHETYETVSRYELTNPAISITVIGHLGNVCVFYTKSAGRIVCLFFLSYTLPLK